MSSPQGTKQHGPVDPPAVQRISTRHQPPRRRFDYWRSLNFLVDLDLPDSRRSKDYRAELLLYQGTDGGSFGYGASDDTIARFSRPEGDFVLFSLATSGKVRLDIAGAGAGTAERIVTPLSGFSVVDGTRPLTSTTRGHAHVYLTVPRDRLAERFEGRGEVLGDGFLSLPRNGLARLLETHLQAVASMGADLDPVSASVALKVATDLALASLAHPSVGGRPLEIERHSDALHAAACRHIRINAGRPDLTAAVVARAVGCSRAQLFRIFEAHGHTVGDVIEASRFEMARTLLSLDLLRPVEQIALRCGFSSGSTFARSFRRHFGMSPTMFRHEGEMRDALHGDWTQGKASFP